MIIKQAYLPLIGQVCFFLDRYTDMHDTNEDIRNISDFGGRWHHGLFCGMFYRQLRNAPQFVSGVDASRLIIKTTHPSQYTDFHNINEDRLTIPGHGGRWNSGLSGGIFDRDLGVWSAGDRIASRSTAIERNIIPLTRTPTRSMKIN